MKKMQGHLKFNNHLDHDILVGAKEMKIPRI